MKRTIQTFEDLEVWKEGVKLRRMISELIKTLPKSEQYLLSDQMKRASRSVTANIAEGYGRFHYQENIQYCRQARGSLYELLDHLSVCVDENYMTKALYGEIREQTIITIKLVNGFINYLNKAKTNEVSDPSINYDPDPH